MSVIGRWLCRLGMHRWGFGTATDAEGDRYTLVTYAWCRRSGCNHPTIIVDREIRWIRSQVE